MTIVNLGAGLTSAEFSFFLHVLTFQILLKCETVIPYCKA